MYFSDIHSHILYGTDDGPKTREEMFKTVDLAYKNGIRLICATPHFHPGYFGDNRESTARSYAVLTEYCDSKYPDIELFLGNELFYLPESIGWLKNGVCLPMGNSRTVLVEFDVNSSEDYIAEAVDRILNVGYLPIIAHAERYRKLSMGRIWAIKQNGALVQANAGVFNAGVLLLGEKRRLNMMLDDNLIDFVSSDTHGTTKRVPDIQSAYDYILKKCGREIADKLCYKNAKRLLSLKGLEEG